MLSYKYIFFDLDGTLSDSAPGIIDSVVYALDKLGIKEKDRASLTKFIGPPLAESFPKYYDLDSDSTDRAVEYFREYYREAGILGNEMYSGIAEMLETLLSAGKRLAVATSKPEPDARIILERYGISDQFDYIGGSLFDKSRIHKYEVIDYVIEALKLSEPETILMVGDRAHDVNGAKKCGLDCMGVLYGYGSRNELESAGAKYIAAEVSDISNIILG